LTITIPWWLERLVVLPVLLYRRIRYGYTFRRIPLTRGKYAIVDPDDYDGLSQYKWQAYKSRNTFYAARFGRRGKDSKRKCYPMHRDVMEIAEGKVCDHISGDGLDNRKANLREASCAENGWNSGKGRVRSRSRYKGLAWDRRFGKWEVRISVNGRRIYIGRFEDESAAARAYDCAAVAYHGRYAKKLNLRD